MIYVLLSIATGLSVNTESAVTLKDSDRELLCSDPGKCSVRNGDFTASFGEIQKIANIDAYLARGPRV